jgi:hypothetical protein
MSERKRRPVGVNVGEYLRYMQTETFKEVFRQFQHTADLLANALSSGKVHLVVLQDDEPELELTADLGPLEDGDEQDPTDNAGQQYLAELT